MRIETRSGTVRTKKGADTPSVEIELGGSERLLDFVIGERGGPGLLAPLEKQAKFQARKTTDWDWEATVECELPNLAPSSRRKNRSTSNGQRRGS